VQPARGQDDSFHMTQSPGVHRQQPAASGGLEARRV